MFQVNETFEGIFIALCGTVAPISALTLMVGRQLRHPACKELDVGLSVVVIWLELSTSYSSSCHHHLHHP